MKNKFVAVHGFDAVVSLLKIDWTTGARSVIARDEVDERFVTFGMFEAEKKGAGEIHSVALLATAEGPLLILDDLKFRPNVHETKINVEDDDQVSHFRVLDDGKPVFGLFYEKKFGIGLHPYLKAREDIDFYYWLSKNINNPKLFQTYTRELKFLDLGG